MNDELMNEATVRAEKLDPLIKMLGYESKTDLNVYREHQFIYPKVSLGRKGKSDKPIIGKPDYICEFRGIARWVLEAKAEGTKLGTAEDAQAYTYAAHPEIRALYYCLSDGKIFVIYKTISPPDSPPLLSVSLDDLDVACTELKVYLSKDALLSVARKLENAPAKINVSNFDIVSGHANFDTVDYHIDCPPQIRATFQNKINEQMELLKGTIYPILNGTFRSNNGVLNIKIELGGHSQRDIEFQKFLGIDRLEFHAVGNGISTDKANPTIFQTRQHANLQPGDIIQSSRAAPQRITFALDFVISVDVFIFREGNKLFGKFKYSTETPMPILGDNSRVAAYIEGNLELIIS